MVIFENQALGIPKGKEDEFFYEDINLYSISRK